MPTFLDRLFPARRRGRLAAAKPGCSRRRIEIHSVTPVPEGRPRFFRVAFTVKDPPGPYSLQFYEAAPDQPEALGKLTPSAAAVYFESRDGAQVRLIETADGDAVWPR